jgi:hypothetical protein
MNKALKTVTNLFLKMIIANAVGYIMARLYKAIRIR